MDYNKTFGEFISENRIKKRLSLRQMANELNMSFVYLGELENNKKTNPNVKIMFKIARFFNLNEDETALFFDLQAKANGTVSMDLSDYLIEKEIARTALRKAEKHSANDEDWQEFIDKVSKK